MTAATLLLLLFAGKSFDRLVLEAERARSAGEWERSLELLEQANAIEPAPELWNNIGRCLEELGRFREAIEWYRRVADDVTADAELRALEIARIAALEPTLSQAHVRTELAGVRVDGTALAPGEDRALSGDLHAIEIVKDGLLILRFERFPLGQRTIITGAQPNAFIDITDRAAVARLTIDGHRLGTPIDTIHSIAIEPGAHDLVIAWRRIGERTLSIQPEDGERIALVRPRAEVPPPLPPPPPITSQPIEIEPRERTNAWPWVIGGAGIAAAGATIGLLISAEADRSRVLDGDLDGEGRVRGVTQAEAAELETSANRKSIGAIATGATAGVLIAGAVIWLLVDR